MRQWANMPLSVRAHASFAPCLVRQTKYPEAAAERWRKENVKWCLHRRNSGYRTVDLFEFLFSFLALDVVSPRNHTVRDLNGFIWMRRQSTNIDTHRMIGCVRDALSGSYFPVRRKRWAEPTVQAQRNTKNQPSNGPLSWMELKWHNVQRHVSIIFVVWIDRDGNTPNVVRLRLIGGKASIVCTSIRYWIDACRQSSILKFETSLVHCPTDSVRSSDGSRVCAMHNTVNWNCQWRDNLIEMADRMDGHTMTTHSPVHDNKREYRKSIDRRAASALEVTFILFFHFPNCKIQLKLQLIRHYGASLCASNSHLQLELTIKRRVVRVASEWQNDNEYVIIIAAIAQMHRCAQQRRRLNVHCDSTSSDVRWHIRSTDTRRNVLCNPKHGDGGQKDQKRRSREVWERVKECTLMWQKCSERYPVATAAKVSSKWMPFECETTSCMFAAKTKQFICELWIVHELRLDNSMANAVRCKWWIGANNVVYHHFGRTTETTYEYKLQRTWLLCSSSTGATTHNELNCVPFDCV